MVSAFGKNLRALRERKNLSQRELAKLLNITNGTISSYENLGQYPQRKEIKEGLLSILECSEVDLFGYSDGYFCRQLNGFKSGQSKVNSTTTQEKLIECLKRNLGDNYSDEILYDVINAGEYDTYQNSIFVTMPDDSMDKIIPVGAIIEFEKNNLLEECCNHIVLAELNNKQYIRRLLKVENSNIYILSPENNNDNNDVVQLSDNNKYELFGIAKSFKYSGRFL